MRHKILPENIQDFTYKRHPAIKSCNRHPGMIALLQLSSSKASLSYVVRSGLAGRTKSARFARIESLHKFCLAYSYARSLRAATPGQRDLQGDFRMKTQTIVAGLL